MPSSVADWNAACAKTVLEAISAAKCPLPWTNSTGPWANSTGLVSLDGTLANVTCSALNDTLNKTPDRNHSEIVGITVGLCEQLCGPSQLTQKTNLLGRNIQVMTTWLFPFIILVSQLPYETESFSYAILSAFLALGSPFLATYSLVLTALNRRYIFHRFRDILAATKEADPQLRTRARYAATILAETQQVPMRASQESNWLSSLVCVDRNTDAFWQKVKDTLAKNRRGWTPSLFTQVIAALLSYFFAYIIVEVDTPDKDTRETGLYFATSVSWSWMFAIVPAGIWVGTQVKPIDTIFTESRAYREDSDDLPQMQYGLFQATTPSSLLGVSPFNGLSLPTWISLDILGFERTRGHIFNFARRNTSLLLVHHVSTAFEKALEISHKENNAYNDARASTTSYARKPVIQELPHAVFDDSKRDVCATEPRHSVVPTLQTNTRLDSSSPAEINHLSAAATPSKCSDTPLEITVPSRDPPLLEASSCTISRNSPLLQVPTTPTTSATKLSRTSLEGTQRPGLFAHAVRCGLTPNARLRVFQNQGHKAFPSPTKQAFLLAVLIAIFHQLGTSGAALYTAYSTFIVGLGCRSGSYLLYGIHGTVSGALLIVSSMLSHDFMVWYEENPAQNQRYIPHSMLWRRIFAVLLRWAGIGIAICNALWLFTFSIMEDVGYFQNCWCEGVLLESLRRGHIWPHWVAVFKEATTSINVVYKVMTVGFVFATLVCFLVVAFFAAISYMTNSVERGLRK